MADIGPLRFVRDFRVIASVRAVYPSIRGYFVTIYSNICNKYIYRIILALNSDLNNADLKLRSGKND